ncbi:TIFY [Musa troglodytarum]|uniref:Protein TIFY n=1 Tax=Musa troglodytarum TaxID=320322 RepID=A0A9E7L9A7_9LILI|nr:TIFY [Musa troglodytarum]
MGWDCTCFLVSRRRKAVISAAKQQQQQPVASPPARSTTSCDPSPLLMERDFLGLNGDAAVALQVKERSRRFQDSSDSISILSVNPAVQWPYANETAAQLQAQSPNAADDCKLKRMTFDHFSFPGLHINPKCFPVVSSQTLSNLGRQGLKQHLTSSAATIASDCPLVSHYSTPLAGSGGATAAEDHSVRSTFLGDRSSWNASKSFSSPSQLTIFYGGSVIVYDNVSSDMAREIMLLASSRNHAAAASTPVSLSPATTNSPRAIPLSRKASLARFVEKRKQRVINYKPYPFYDKRRDANSSAAVTLAIHENSDSDSGPSSHGSQ